jgi:hypothetical protein
MDLKKLFPPSMQEAKDETCVIGEQQFRLDEVRFSSIAETALPDAVFIDGGSAALFSTPARCIGLIKVCAIHTAGLERKEIRLNQYLVSITANGRGFAVQSEPLGESSEEISRCLDGELIVPDATPEMLLDPLRTMAERAIAPQWGIVIHDGSFRTTNVLLQKCPPGTNASALSKTSGTVTSKQRPIGMALLTRAPKGAWHAHLAKGISCVRLHNHAAHTFLLEGNASAEVLSLLVAWSNDMTFPGYPYPLVLADQMARVTNNERDAWRIVLSNDENAMQILADELKASDAHAMLEHILYGR